MSAVSDSQTNQAALRILYVGTLGAGGTCQMRGDVLKSLGHLVIDFDMEPYVARYFSSNPILRRLLPPRAWPSVRQLNQDLLNAVQKEKPQLVWVDKGLLIHQSTLQAMKSGISTVTAHYNPDDPFGEYARGWDTFIDAIGAYDVHFVPRPQNVEEYKALGAAKVVTFDRGYDPRVHRPIALTPEERQLYGAPVGFVGTYAPAREQSIAYLIENGIDLSIRGDGWPNGKLFHITRRCWRGPSLYRDDYVKAICGLDIALHFVRRENRDQQDSRTFEIPACGAFMLAERTEKHLELFEEQKEAEFFGTDEELLEKVRYYGARPEQRRQIADAGKERCIRSGYGYFDRMKRFLEIAMETPR